MNGLLVVQVKNLNAEGRTTLETLQFSQQENLR